MPTKSYPRQPLMSVEQLQQLRPRLTVSGRKLDLGVTLYTFQLDKRIIAHLKYFDIVSLWTWEAADLAKLEKNLAKFQAIAPGKRVLLGLYMWDFSGKGRPMPLDLMKKQCNLALKWLREGRIEGMIFLATNLCDLNLEAVKWSRSWIAEVGDQPLDRISHHGGATFLSALEISGMQGQTGMSAPRTLCCRLTPCGEKCGLDPSDRKQATPFAMSKRADGEKLPQA